MYLLLSESELEGEQERQDRGDTELLATFHSPNVQNPVQCQVQVRNLKSHLRPRYGWQEPRLSSHCVLLAQVHSLELDQKKGAAGTQTRVLRGCLHYRQLLTLISHNASPYNIFQGKKEQRQERREEEKTEAHYVFGLFYYTH